MLLRLCSVAAMTVLKTDDNNLYTRLSLILVLGCVDMIVSSAKLMGGRT